MLVAGRQQLPPIPVVAAHLKFDEVPWGWRLSSEVFPLPHKSIITFVSFLFYAKALILKEASPSSHVTVQKRMVTTAPGILLQYAAYDRTAIKTFLYECPCPLSFMQTWPNAGLFYIKQPLIKHVLDHEAAVVSVPETWNWCSCLVKCIADFIQAVVSVPGAPAVRYTTCTFDGLGNSLSFLWKRKWHCGLICLHDNHSFIVMLLNEVCDATAVRLSLTVSPWSLRIIK